MKVSQNGLNLIKEFEGCKLKAYQDSVGVWTIGWGTTNSDKSITGTTIQSGLKISQATADSWLEKSVNAKYAPAVEKYCKNLNQNQFDALVSFTYNCGEGSLKTLVSNRTPEQIAEHITAYNKAGGKVLVGLTRRRNAEKALFLTAVIENVDILDINLYYSMYEDLQNAIGYNEQTLRDHYFTYGIKEGRIASYIFNPKFYLSKYEDLRNAFGNNYELAYNHFINNGMKEGRQASSVFDVKFYLDNNTDLKAKFGNNYIEAFKHFLAYGINEARMTSNEFNVIIYKDTYQDLQNSFGDNMKSYFKHYLMFGKAEGRKCK